MAGTAREEAERLIAAVLAMAGQGGADERSKDESLSSTAHRVTEGLGSLGETLAGVVGQLARTSSDNRGSTGDPTSGDPTSGDPTSAGPAPGRSASGGPAPGGSASGGAASGGSASGGSASVGHFGSGWSTGSAECCVCPLCRMIAGMRDPSPLTAVRLATGAGDLATSVASVMRAVSAMTSNPRPKPSRAARPAAPTPDQAWSTATRIGDPATGQPDRDQVPPIVEPPVGADIWSAASRADAVAAAAEQAEQRAKAAHRAAAEQAARQAAEAGRRVEAARRAAEALAAQQAEAARQAESAREAAAATTVEAGAEPGTAGQLRGRGPVPSVGASGPRTEKGFAVSENAGRPRNGRDVWAAATAEGDLAPKRDVDHDVAGPATDAGRADPGSEPTADA